VQLPSSGATGGSWTTSCTLPTSKRGSSSSSSGNGRVHHQLQPHSRSQHQPSSSRRKASCTVCRCAATAHLTAVPLAHCSAQQPRKNPSSVYATHPLSTPLQPSSHHRLKGRKLQAQQLLAQAAEQHPWQPCWAARQQLPTGSSQQQRTPARHPSSTAQGWQGFLQHPSTAAQSPQHNPKQPQANLELSTHQGHLW
jgi:hypothetical protein